MDHHIKDAPEEPRVHPFSNTVLFTDPSPYPEVTGPKDAGTVAMLKQDYAGAAGELTAITQYIFQNVSTADNATFTNALLKIAVSEMSHLHMLGDTIKVLGGNPSFTDGQRYWSAANLNFGETLKEKLLADIKAESTAIANYEKHASLTKNKSVKALLLRIAKDEKLHLRFFEEMLEKM